MRMIFDEKVDISTNVGRRAPIAGYLGQCFVRRIVVKEQFPTKRLVKIGVDANRFRCKGFYLSFPYIQFASFTVEYPGYTDLYNYLAMSISDTPASLDSVVTIPCKTIPNVSSYGSVCLGLPSNSTRYCKNIEKLVEVFWNSPFTVGSEHQLEALANWEKNGFPKQDYLYHPLVKIVYGEDR